MRAFSFAICFVTAICSEELGTCMTNHSKGLLSNIHNISTAEYFTSNMSMEDAALMALNYSYVYKEAVEDARTLREDITNYLTRIYKASADFIHSNVLWDRKDVMDILEKTVSTETGALMCVLGGKSTGKSFVLNQLESKYPENVFIINMRSYENFLPGLIDVIKRRLEWKSSAISDDVAGVSDLFGFFKPKTDEFKKQLKEFLKVQGNDSSISKALERLVFYVKKVTIVIDEANLAMIIDDNDHVKKAKATFLAAVLTSMTKERKQVFKKKYSQVIKYF
jgi:hypothetical protein